MMRKISEMYKRSGGTSWEHRCGECGNYVHGKNSACTLYPEECSWKEEYTACRFFCSGDSDGQMSIFE